MKRYWIHCLAMLLCLSLASHDAFARGGGGGGGRGGFGGGGGGGGFGGGGAGGLGGAGFSGGNVARPAPSPSMNRSPSMSRPAMPAQQPNFSAGARPNVGSAAVSRPATPVTRPANASQNFQRPTQNQVGDFLGLPQHSGAGTFSSGSASGGVSTLPSGGNSRSYTTAGGTTITVGGKGGSGTTAGGVQVGGAVGGIKVEGAGGNTYVKGGGAIGATDGTNSAIRGGSVTGVQGSGGNKAVNVRGGYADSAGNRQVGGATAIQGKGGYTAVNIRGAAGNGGTGTIGSATAIRGPGGNVVAAGRGAAFVNGQFVGGRTWQTVNGNFNHWNCFYAGWYGRYPGAWWPGKWAVVSSAWAAVAWTTAGAYCGCEGDGTYYDYGTNVTYENGIVFNGDEPVATQEQYYSQANEIAAAGDNASNEEWLPLGVFAIVAEGQTNADKVAQLAVNKEGVIKGNLHDTLADSVVPVTGAVDKKTQRVAMRIQGNDKIVVETGLYNLTNDEVPVLVHFGASRQEQRTLVRLQQKDETPE